MSEDVNINDESIFCESCGKEIEVDDEYYHDEFLLNLFGYVFCSKDCHDWFVESK